MKEQNSKYTEEDEAKDIFDLVYLNNIVCDCYCSDIQEMFKDDFDSKTNRIKFNNKIYQCVFSGLRCIKVYMIV